MDTEYRLLIVSGEVQGRFRESVYFLEADDDTPAEDYCASGQTVDFDGAIMAELPSNFPVDYELRNSG